MLYFSSQTTQCGPCACYRLTEGPEEGRHGNCSSRGLTTIPNNRDVKKVKFLQLSNNNINDFQALSSFNRLRAVIIHSNGIQSLAGLLQGKYSVLDLTGNTIANCASHDASSESKLRDIIGLECDAITGNPFSMLGYLSDLGLTIHSPTIGEDIFNGSKIIHLKLTVTKAESLPSDLLAPLSSTLESLEIRGELNRSLSN